MGGVGRGSHQGAQHNYVPETDELATQRYMKIEKFPFFFCQCAGGKLVQMLGFGFHGRRVT